MSGLMVCRTRLNRNERHHHRGPGDVVDGSGCRWFSCCLVGAIITTIAGMQGNILRTWYTAMDANGTHAAPGCRRNRYRRSEGVMYSGKRRWCACCPAGAVDAIPRGTGIARRECEHTGGSLKLTSLPLGPSRVDMVFTIYSGLN